MRAGGQRRNVRLARAVMLSAIAQGNRRQQGQEPQPTAAARLLAGRPAPGVGYITRERGRERERERERERAAGSRMATVSVLAQDSGRQYGRGSQPTAAVRLTAGRPAPGVGYISKRERERERERDLGENFAWLTTPYSIFSFS